MTAVWFVVHVYANIFKTCKLPIENIVNNKQFEVKEKIQEKNTLWHLTI